MRMRRRKLKSDEYIQEAITQLLVLKFRYAASGDSVRELIEKCLSDATRLSGRQQANQGLDIHKLGSVLREWHVNSRYLQADGTPRQLPIRGRGGLTSLIKEFYPNSRVEMVVDRLIAARLIRKSRDGKWLPTTKHARIPQLSFETLEHLSEGVVRYVETVTKNVTARRESDVLFERSAKVSRLPTRELAAFREYVNQQAIAFITAVDDWLESRNLAKPRKGARVKTAGVYTFAYIHPPK